MLHRNNRGNHMVEMVDRRNEPEKSARRFGSCRAVVSAWAVVALLLVLLFAGAEALASWRAHSPHRASLAGAVLPRHDPACARPGLPAGPTASGCPAYGTALEEEDRGDFPW